jgi:hypothetical protein
MKKILGLLFLASMTTSLFADTTGRGGIFFGKKSLNHSDWGDLDSQPAWGINLDVKNTNWPVWMTAGYVSSRDEINVIASASPLSIINVEGKTSEIQLGAKKDFAPAPQVRLSLAAGPSFVHASLGSTTSPFRTESDSSVGFWTGAEAIFFLRYLTLGASYSFSQADVDLFGRSVDAGGQNLAFTVGFGW